MNKKLMFTLFAISIITNASSYAPDPMYIDDVPAHNFPQPDGRLMAPMIRASAVRQALLEVQAAKDQARENGDMVLHQQFKNLYNILLTVKHKVEYEMPSKNDLLVFAAESPNHAYAILTVYGADGITFNAAELNLLKGLVNPDDVVME